MVDAPARTEEITCKLGSLRSGCAPADSGITVSWPEVQSEWRDVSDGSKCEVLAQGTHFRVAPITNWCFRQETPFVFLVPPSRCELLLVRSLSVFGKKSPTAGSRSRTVDPE